MSDEIRKYFSDSANCYHDLGTARKAFGSNKTTKAEYDQMEKSLGLMYLYCPEDIRGIVLATMEEAEMRRFYFEINWLQQAEHKH